MYSRKDNSCVRTCDGMPPRPDFNTVGSGLSQNAPRKLFSFGSALTAIESSPSPVPYTFRVPAPTPQACRRGTCTQNAKAPPFCLQLDHTLAVLWCLFRKKSNKASGSECELGVGQLQWALFFLKGIKSPNGGDRAEDVSIAIQAVEDALLDLYADMSEVVMQPPQPGAPFSPGSVPVYGGSVLTTSQLGTSDVQPPCTVCAAERNKPIIPTWVPPVPASPCNKCSSVTLGTHKGEGRPRKSGPRKEELSTSSSKSRQNYRTMTSPMGSSHIRFQNAGKPTTCTRDPLLEKEIKELRRAAAELSQRMPSSSQDESSRQNDMSMLQEWRKEQVNRVQDELRRLRSLDSALGIDSDITEVTSKTRTANTTSFGPGIMSTRRPSASR